MTITICASMSFAKEALEVKERLENLGHLVYVSDFIKKYLNKTDKEIKKIDLKDKLENDAINMYYRKIKESDAILVLNFDKKEIKNYIGGNVLMEVGFAYVLNKKIFLLNPIPKIEYYQSEIEAVKPIILNGDLSKI